MLTLLRPTYPDSAAVEAFLEATGLTLTANQTLLLDGIAAAAAQEFETAVDRSMLPASAASLRYFDPPVNRDRLLFVDDLSAAPSLVQIVPYGSSAETLAVGVDYRLEPANAVAKREPITRLRLLSRRWLTPLSDTWLQSIQITGLWGYAATLPDDVWQAVCMRAGYLLWQQVVMNTTGGVLGWKDGDRSVDYGIERWTGPLKLWCGDDGRSGVWGQTIARYRKLGF